MQVQPSSETNMENIIAKSPQKMGGWEFFVDTSLANILWYQSSEKANKHVLCDFQWIEQVK